jgi:hypothetical protein
MNNVIQEYLALVERTVYQSDLDAFDALEQLEEDYPELADLVYQQAGPLAYDIQNNEVIS